MPSQFASLFEFDFYETLPIQVEVSDAPLTSDAGNLAIAPDQGRGVGGGELPPHRGETVRQLAEPAVFRAGCLVGLSELGK